MKITLTKKESEYLSLLKKHKVTVDGITVSFLNYLEKRYNKDNNWHFVVCSNDKDNNTYCLFYQLVNGNYMYSDMLYFGEGFANIFKHLGYKVVKRKIAKECFYNVYAMRHLSRFEIIFHYH